MQRTRPPTHMKHLKLAKSTGRQELPIMHIHIFAMVLIYWCNMVIIQIFWERPPDNTFHAVVVIDIGQDHIRPLLKGLDLFSDWGHFHTVLSRSRTGWTLGLDSIYIFMSLICKVLVLSQSWFLCLGLGWCGLANKRSIFLSSALSGWLPFKTGQCGN